MSASRSTATASASARAMSSGARSAAQRSSGSATALALRQPLLDSLEALAQLLVLLLERRPTLFRVEALQRRVALPPVDAHLTGAVDRGDQQPKLDRQQLDVEQVDLDVAGDDDALVEHPFEDVREVVVRARGGMQLSHRHSPARAGSAVRGGSRAA